MVLKKIKGLISGSDDKYEALYYKYSQLKLENKNLKQGHQVDMSDYKRNVNKAVANEIIKIYEHIEDARKNSFKVNAVDPNIQRLLMDVNSIERSVNDVMKKIGLEAVKAEESMYDPELHEVASYSEAKGMKKGMIIKTVKKGFKYRNETMKKPRVIVTQ